MAILKPYIAGKYLKKRKKQQSTENQKNAKTEYKLSGGPVFTFSLTGGGLFSTLVSRQLHQGSANFFARRTGFCLALFCRLTFNKIMNVWHMRICYNS